MRGRSVASAMRLKWASAISGDCPKVKGAGGKISSAEAPPSAAMRAILAASMLPSAHTPLTSGSRSAIAFCEMASARRCFETAGGDLGRMRVDGDGGEPFGGRHVAQMAAEALFVDRKVIVEGQQHGRNDAVGEVAGVTGHFRLLISPSPTAIL